MIGRCIEDASPFGVVLIREGVEVGGDAEPHDTGCTARIAQLTRLEDGRMNIIALGEERFRIAALDREEPYLQGEVDLLENIDAAAPEVRELASRVVVLFGEHFKLGLALTGQWMRELELPKEPGALADFIAGNLELPVPEKQELLETLSVPDRLSRIAVRLAERIAVLTERWNEKRQQQFGHGVRN